jgi:hypothetical protein
MGEDRGHTVHALLQVVSPVALNRLLLHWQICIAV